MKKRFVCWNLFKNDGSFEKKRVELERYITVVRHIFNHADSTDEEIIYNSQRIYWTWIEEDGRVSFKY